MPSIPSLSERGLSVFFNGESSDTSMSSSSSSAEVIGFLLKRVSLVADDWAISEMSLMIGSLEVN